MNGQHWLWTLFDADTIASTLYAFDMIDAKIPEYMCSDEPLGTERQVIWVCTLAAKLYRYCNKLRARLHSTFHAKEVTEPLAAALICTPIIGS